MRKGTMLAMALAAAGAAVFFASWPMEANFWANVGCGTPASCAYTGATLFRIIGLAVMGLAVAVLSIQWLLQRRATAPPHV